MGAVLEAAAVGLALTVFLSSQTFQPYMWLGVMLLAGSFLLRWQATGQAIRRTPLDLPLLFFVLSAAIGVWAAYDRPTAWIKFFLIASSVAVYYTLAARASDPWFAVATVLLLSLFGTALAVYFVTQYDFAASGGKVAAIGQVGRWINHLSPHIPGHRPHPNIVAATLEIILPLSVAAAVGLQGQIASLLRPLLLPAGVVIAGGVIMTGSRGAWLALALVGAAAAILSWVRRRVPEQWQGRVIAAGLAAGCLLVVVTVLTYPGDLLTKLLGSIPGGERAIGRGELYGQALALIRDYPLTGSGLGMFPMVFSTYVLLIWVPFLTHAHNLFLQVWIEQGLLGFVAFIWLVVAFYVWVWRTAVKPGAQQGGLLWLALGGAAATAVLLVHGLVDVGLYSSRALPLMLMPMGLASSQVSVVSSQRDDRRPTTDDGYRSAVTGWPSSAAVVVILVLGACCLLLARPYLAALWEVNLGSVAQTQAELEDYTFPEHLVDYVRYDGDLSEAERHFGQTLAYDPTNVTARRRLALIALGRGEHEVARDYLEPAYALNPADAITRQLLGEAYLGLGRLEEAYALLSGLPGATGRLQGVAWVRYDRNGDKERAGWARTLASTLPPD